MNSTVLTTTFPLITNDWFRAIQALRLSVSSWPTPAARLTPSRNGSTSEGAPRRMNFASDADVTVGFKTNRRPPSAERVPRVTDRL
jgi:hypothetical protein